MDVSPFTTWGCTDVITASLIALGCQPRPASAFHSVASTFEFERYIIWVRKLYLHTGYNKYRT
jgi:hypothetical protein